MLFTVVSLLCVVFGLIYYLTKLRYGYYERRGIPGPKPSFPFGNTPNSFTMKQNVTHDWDKIYKDFKGKTSIVGAFEMHSPKIVVIDPETIKTVMIKNFKSFHDTDLGQLIDKESDPIFGRNPFILRGEEWKNSRAEITPAFTPNRMKAMFPLVVEVTKTLKKYLKDEHQNAMETFDIASRFTTDVVSSCIFNADAQSFTKKNAEILQMGKNILDQSNSSFFLFALFSFFPWLLNFKKLRFINKDTTEFFITLLNQAVKQREKDQIRREDYLSYLMSLRQKKQFGDIDMTAHGVTFFTDGFLTSSAVISHSIFELANNKSVQEKLRKELENVYDENENLKYDELIENEYLDQVFNETLRMHPPVFFLSRECSEPTEITDSITGKTYKIRKFERIHIPVYSLHYDAEYFDEPKKFKPERFNAENGGIKSYRDKGVFLPFGDGPRICLGMRFAVMQSKAAIATIIKNFEVSVDKKTKLPLEVDPKEFLNVNKYLWLNYKPIK